MIAKKKAEREAMLAAEEASGPSKVKSAPKAGSKKKAPITGLDAGPRAPPGQGIANFSVNDPLNLRTGRDEDTPIEELSATGIDAMMEALEVANQKTDKQAMGAKVSPWSQLAKGPVVSLELGRMKLIVVGRGYRTASRGKLYPTSWAI